MTGASGWFDAILVPVIAVDEVAVGVTTWGR